MTRGRDDSQGPSFIAANNAGNLRAIYRGEAASSIKRNGLSADNPCGKCAKPMPMRGQFPIDEVFPVWWTMRPGAHPRCECSLGPVVGPADDESGPTKRSSPMQLRFDDDRWRSAIRPRRWRIGRRARSLMSTGRDRCGNELQTRHASFRSRLEKALVQHHYIVQGGGAQRVCGLMARTGSRCRWRPRCMCRTPPMTWMAVVNSRGRRWKARLPRQTIRRSLRQARGACRSRASAARAFPRKHEDRAFPGTPPLTPIILRRKHLSPCSRTGTPHLFTGEHDPELVAADGG